MAVLANRARMTTTTTGTGTITLGSAVSGYQTFAAAGVANGDVVRYVIENGTAWEIGTGTYTTSGTTLSRTLVESSTGSLLNLSGTSEVFITAAAEDLEAPHLPALAAEPAVPPASSGLLYARSIAGRVLPKWIGPSGVDWPIQPSLALNNITMWRGGNGTTSTDCVSVLGTMPFSAVASTFIVDTPTTSSVLSQTQRTRLTSSSTAGNTATLFTTLSANRRFVIASGQNIGGFFCVFRFRLHTLIANNMGFFGLTANTSIGATVNPVTVTSIHRAGLAFSTNTGNWRFVTGAASSPTSVDLGSNFPINTTSLIELVLFAPPNSASGPLGYRVTDLSTGQQTTGSTSSTLPTNFMGPYLQISNNATASAVAFDFVSFYGETDF